MPREKKTEEVDMNEFWNYVDFGKSTGLFQNIYNPDLVAARLKDITLNPLQADEDKINTALLNPKQNEDQLIGYGQYFELTDMLYKRMLLYLGNLPSWDLQYVCSNIEDDKDYTSLAYRKDEKTMENFLNAFDYKSEFSTIFRQLLRQETYYGMLRDDGEKYVMQELPYQYCKITGRFDYGILFDLNLYYFIQPGVDLRGWPQIVTKKFNQVFGGKKSGEYIPSNSLDERTGKYVFWVQTSPEDNFYCFKMTPEVITQVPFFSGMFQDVVLRPLIRNLQKSKYIQQATKLVVALIGMNKDTKSGSIRDQINISPETAGRFVNLMRQGISKEISLTTGPWQDIKSFEWQSDQVSILDQYTKNTIGSGGNNTRLLYNSSDRSNVVETINSIAIDEVLITKLYPWFSNFLEYYINKKTKKYKFKFWFTGTTMPASNETQLANALSLAEIGIVLPQLFAAGLDTSPIDFEKQIAMGKASKFVEKLTPIIKASQMSAKSDSNGRPQSKVSDLGDEGATTRAAGSNISKGGKV